MFEKPVLNIIKFELKDILASDASGETPTPEPTSTTSGGCRTDTGFEV